MPAGIQGCLALALHKLSGFCRSTWLPPCSVGTQPVPNLSWPYVLAYTVVVLFASWSGLWSVKIKPEITQPTLFKQAVCKEKWKLCLFWHQADACLGLAPLEEQCRDSIIGSMGFSSSGLVQQLALYRQSLNTLPWYGKASWISCLHLCNTQDWE